MAINNHSTTINNDFYDDRFSAESYKLICEFDRLATTKEKADYIRRIEISSLAFAKDLAFRLRDRIKYPPRIIPDSKLLTLDASTLDKIGLLNLITKMRLLLVLSYRTV